MELAMKVSLVMANVRRVLARIIGLERTAIAALPTLLAPVAINVPRAMRRLHAPFALACMEPAMKVS